MPEEERMARAVGNHQSSVLPSSAAEDTLEVLVSNSICRQFLFTFAKPLPNSPNFKFFIPAYLHVHYSPPIPLYTLSPSVCKEYTWHTLTLRAALANRQTTKSLPNLNTDFNRTRQKQVQEGLS